MNSLSPAATSILEELAYFDLFDFPLTPLELWRYQRNRTGSVTEIQRILAGELAGKVEETWGMYHLPGRSEIIQLRQRRYRQAEEKYRRVARYVRWLSYFPFVEMVGVCNSLAYSNARPEADIDVFVVTTPGRIWTARFFATGWMKVLGQRPAHAHMRDTLCLSFFINRDKLDLAPVKLTDDVYLAHWVWQVVPVYDPTNVYPRFLDANRWAREYFPQAYPMDTSDQRRILPTWSSRSAQKVVQAIHRGRIGDWLERIYERFQRSILPEPLRRQADHGSAVVLNDAMLKFHDQDRREEFRTQWQRKLQEHHV